MSVGYRHSKYYQPKACIWSKIDLIFCKLLENDTHTIFVLLHTSKCPVSLLIEYQIYSICALKINRWNYRTGILVSNLAPLYQPKWTFFPCKMMSQLPLAFIIKPTHLTMASTMEVCILPIAPDLRPHLSLPPLLCAGHTGLCSGFPVCHAVSYLRALTYAFSWTPFPLKCPCPGSNPPAQLYHPAILPSSFPSWHLSHFSVSSFVQLFN